MRNWAISAALLLAACGGGKPAQWITRAELGRDWPFVVDAGHVACLPGGIVYFRAEGKSFGLNGPGIQEFGPPDPIWAPDPEAPGARKSIAAVLEIGRGLCP